MSEPTTGARHRLFSYGTLRFPEVQRATFGREITGQADAIVGYRSEMLTITDPMVIKRSGTDRHPILVPGSAADAVEGTTFLLTDEDLAAADHYEVDDYQRVEVPLRSGQLGWVYLLAAAPGAVD